MHVCIYTYNIYAVVLETVLNIESNIQIFEYSILSYRYISYF